eukprot:CAMPEP_0202904734 /NCGR_PEP_ID=MMETSP1392-20130828/30867_1 /ASSEMBLY_ACC=CAM_ASM_000868 /TAXON_ID=225041 /ORGANISM="Chlamydomonas chlamydogama, Strain SAG 11-48b" /LENGTH=70 /DNA_ID=CAMNT_0049592521 /DNA_START=461 /DNA_END=670 /DNA_ORIENTATION=+
MSNTDWATRLHGLVGLSEQEKGEAVLILVNKDELRRCVFLGSNEAAVSSVRALLRAAETAAVQPSAAPSG